MEPWADSLSFIYRLPVLDWMSVETFQLLRLVTLRNEWMRVRERVITDARYLPANLLTWDRTRNHEFTVTELLLHMQAWRGLTECRQLIEEVAIQRRKPIRKTYEELAVGVSRTTTVVDVLSFG
jgi:hypothetical protein